MGWQTRQNLELPARLQEVLNDIDFQPARTLKEFADGSPARTAVSASVRLPCPLHGIGRGASASIWLSRPTANR
jgi:hypothetical protein